MEHLLLLLIIMPLIPSCWVQITQCDSYEHAKLILHISSMGVAQMTFILSLLLNEYTPGYIYAGGEKIKYLIAYDGISVIFLLVTAFLTCLCIISLCEFTVSDEKIKEMVQLLFLLEFVLFNFFLTRDIFFFYVFFEAALPILFLIIMLGGERNLRLRAAYMLFIYTLIFSLFTLGTIVYLNRLTGTTDLFELILCDFSPFQQMIIFTGLLIGISVKIPTNPFHVWLPHAHVEASTLGSVLLAGIILKMGGYAIGRILLPLCPIIYDQVANFARILGYMSVINTSLIIITEADLKRLIAYFSIVHMNVSLIAIFAVERLAILGSLGMMVSHSIVASGLFFCIGVLYERYQHRDMSYYGGLANAHINFCIIFFLFVLSNFSFPLTFSFWPEIILLTGLIVVSYLDIVVILASSIFSVASNLILFTRVFFCYFTEYIEKFADLTFYEIFLLGTLLFNDIWYGLNPNLYLVYLEQPVNFLLTACTILN